MSGTVSSGSVVLPFPWSAVLGQERLKLALILCAIDPNIGGVLVRGPRGVAKTTLARGFAELLPGRFVELPLGATEERVTGSLDLGKVLEHGQVEFSPGLLARAHQGVLYVDEVNLLPDVIVDVLLDAAASGRNIVERDGVSHVHDARFVLIGTMNPEEGELRPQLVDRFGLSVIAEREIAPRERAEIVTRRLNFELDPQRFRAAHAAAQRELTARCARARESVQSLPLAGPALERTSELCHAAGVEGVRADLAMLRAARAHAAWQGHTEISASDVDTVAELALEHRRRPERSGSGGAGGTPSGSRAAPRNEGSGGVSARGASPRAAEAADPPAGDQGALPPVPVRALDVPSFSSESLARACGSPAFGRTNNARRRRPWTSQLRWGGIDWFASFARTRRPSRAEIQRRRRPLPRRELWVIAIDCSSSMIDHGALALAKGAARELSRAGARTGADVTVLSFRADTVRVEYSSRSRAGVLETAIGELGAGGGTPMRQAALVALDLCRRASLRSEYAERRLFVFTDGRTREDLGGLEALVRSLGCSVFDCERGPLRLGRARALAAALGARYVHAEAFMPAPSATRV